MQSKNMTLLLTVNAVIAAAYAALTIVLAPISYGPIQLRVSEAVTALPFLMPGVVPGIVAGCVLGRQGNTVKNRLLGCSMPVLFNAVIVGAVLTWGYKIQEFPSALGSYGFNALTVGLGEMAVLFLLGYPLLVQLPKIKSVRALIDRVNQK